MAEFISSHAPLILLLEITFATWRKHINCPYISHDLPFTWKKAFQSAT